LKTLIVDPAGVGKTSLIKNALQLKGKSAGLTGEGDERATIGVDINYSNQSEKIAL